MHSQFEIKPLHSQVCNTRHAGNLSIGGMTPLHYYSNNYYLVIHVHACTLGNALNCKHNPVIVAILFITCMHGSV